MNPHTGGYDLCLEAGEDVLSAFVAAAVGGQELFIPVQFAELTGLVYLLVERAELAIDPSREASALVTVAFRDSSVQLALPGSTGPVGPLAGELRSASRSASARSLAIPIWAMYAASRST
jgi:hypothetical protein